MSLMQTESGFAIEKFVENAILKKMFKTEDS